MLLVGNQKVYLNLKFLRHIVLSCLSYPIMNNLDKCNDGCATVHDLFAKICLPSKTKDANFKAFKTILKASETLIKHISCDSKWKFNSTTCNSNQKWNNKTC